MHIARPSRPSGVHMALITALLGLTALLATVATAAPLASCSVCGKNLIKNPGAEAGAGITSVDGFGAVPGWKNVAGQFGAASYAFPNGWFSKTTKGPKDRGKNYFFGGTTTAAVSAKASIGQQVIKLPVSAVGHKATLSGWLGNYGTDKSQVRAAFADSSGKVLGTVRIGPDTTISGTDMAARSRSTKVPAGTKQVTIIVTFAGGVNYKLQGVDDLSLIIA